MTYTVSSGTLNSTIPYHTYKFTANTVRPNNSGTNSTLTANAKMSLRQ